MKLINKLFLICVISLVSISTSTANTDSSKVGNPIPTEPLMKIEVLPSEYPDTWFFAHDAHFHSLIAGRVVLLDAAANTKEYKGALDAAQFATFVESKINAELYVAETFYSRGTTGDRTDVISVYDKSSFLKTSEIILPKKNRGLIVTNKYATQLVDNDRYLLVFNFTPASAVTIIDTKTKKILSELALPGCSMIYPTGKRGFSSLCADGAMVSIQFDAAGQELSRNMTPPFFDPDSDPIFDKPAYINGVAYFVTYLGQVIPVDMMQEKPKVLSSWSMVSKRDQKRNWRPSGWQVVTGHDDDLFVIFAKDGFNGSHKSGGEEIWHFSLSKGKLLNKIKTETPSFSIEYIAAEEPLIAVTNIGMAVDIYTPKGKFQRSIVVGDTSMPIILHATK